MVSSRLARPIAGAVLLAALGAGILPAYAAPSPYDDGLLGRQDPASADPAVRYSVTAFTQSLALLGVVAGGRTTAPQTGAAVGWLLRQQCPDGGWQIYRTNPTTPCLPTNPAAYSGEDTNTTALAVQALAALHVTPRRDPLPWLRAAQNTDGGFGYVRGSGTDPNSTGLVLQALAARGVDPRTWTSGTGKTPYDALLSFQLGCAAPPADRGGFYSFDPNSPDVSATAAALPGLVGQAYPVPAGRLGTAHPVPTCQARPAAGTKLKVRPAATPADAAGYGASWLAGQVTPAGYVAGPSGPAYGLTAFAVLGLTATGTNGAAAVRAGAFLAGHVDPAAKDAHGLDQVGTLGLLAMTAAATGQGSAAPLATRILANCTGRCGLAPSPSPRATAPAGTPAASPPAAPTPRATGNAGTLPMTGAPIGLLLTIASGLAVAGIGLRRLATRR